MFIRKKKNKSGSISIQIIDKSSGRFNIIKVVGCASNEQQKEDLIHQANELLAILTRQSPIDFIFSEDELFLKQLQQGLKRVVVIGPELVLGKIFNEIGCDISIIR